MLSPPTPTPPPPSPPPLPSPPASSAQSPPLLTLTGVLYFGGNEGKSIELFASAAIPDLSAYSLGVASNGRADEIDYTLPAESAAAGQHIWVARGTNDQFRSEYGRNATYASTGSWISFNGDDNVLLWTGGSVVDRYGVANTDGTGEPWEYSAGTILYRASNTRPTAAFDLAQWRVETSADALGTFEMQPPPPSSPPAPAPPSSAPRLPPPSTSFPPSPPPASSAQPPSGPVEYSWYCAEDPTKSSRYPVCDSLCAGGEAICCEFPALSSSHPTGTRCTGSSSFRVPDEEAALRCGARPPLCDDPAALLKAPPVRGLSQLSYYYQLADRPPIEVEMSISRDEALSYMVRQISDGDCYMLSDRLVPRWPGYGAGGVDCTTLILAAQGDGACDQWLNTEPFGFDGGDCDPALALPWATEQTSFSGDGVGPILQSAAVDRGLVALQVANGTMPCPPDRSGYECTQTAASLTVGESVQFLSSGWRFFESMLRYAKDNADFDASGGPPQTGGLLFLGGGSCRYATGAAGDGVTFEEVFNYSSVSVPTTRRCYGGASLTDMYFNRDILLGELRPRYLLLAAFSDVGRRSDEQGTGEASFRVTLEAWIEYCRAAGITLFVGGFKPSLEESHVRDIFNETSGVRGRLNSWMRSLAGMRLIDWAPFLLASSEGGEGGPVPNASYYVADDTHQSGAGYRRLWQAAKPILDGVILAEAAPPPPPTCKEEWRLGCVVRLAEKVYESCF